MTMAAHDGTASFFRQNSMTTLTSPPSSTTPPIRQLSGSGFLFSQNSTSSSPLYLATGGSTFNGATDSSAASPLSSMAGLESGLWSSRQNTDPFGNFRASLQNGELSCLADSLAREFYSAQQISQVGAIGTSTSSPTASRQQKNRDISDSNGSNSSRYPFGKGATHGSHMSNEKHATKHVDQTRRGSVSSSASSLESFELVTYSNQNHSKNGSQRVQTSTPPDSAQEGLNTSWSAVVQRNPRPVKARSNLKNQRASKTFNVKFPACCTSPRIKISCAGCNEESFVKVMEEVKPRLIPVSTSQLGFCRFCQTNGDPPEVYQGHSLRSDDGRVTCPVLREYNCPICNNGGGDFAHTIKYCPLARKSKPGQSV